VNPQPEWTALLACGRRTRPLQSEPKVGGWITCRAGGHCRITAALPACGTPGPGQAAIQDQLWEQAA
jgi:hypothetical protein